MENKKTGPKPKELKQGSIFGLEIGRGDNKNIVPPEDVYKLAAIGCTDNEISGFFEVKPDTLRRNFAAELAKGREWTKIRLRKAMFENACDNMHASVQIFLAKNVLGMSDSPIDAEANAPLPWNETDDTVEIGDEYEEETQGSSDPTTTGFTGHTNQD
jgi:hypothetical protein